jgi:hypothetical protein
MAPPPPKLKKTGSIPAKPPLKAPPPRKKGWLGSVDEGLKEKRSRCIVLCGGSGLGKTSFAAQMPKPLFIMDSQETGLLDLLQRPGLIPPGVGHGKPVEHWKQLMDTLDELISEGGPKYVGYESLVLESITGFEKFLFDYSCTKDWSGNWDRFMDYSKGPKQAAKRYWSTEFLTRLTVLRDQGWHLCLTAHSQVNTKDNTEGADYTAEIPFCDKQTWQNTHRWAECAIFMALSPVLESKSGVKAKAGTEGQRFIHVGTSPVYGSKNRWDISGVLHMDGGPAKAWKDFCSWVGLNPRTMHFQ